MPHRFVSRLFLALLLGSFVPGWRSATPPVFAPFQYPINMTLAEDRLYVSDGNTGVQVFDVSDLAAPKKLLQIPLRGNRGSAVKGDIVFANQYGQLQAIRITGDTYTVVARIGVEFSDSPPWNEDTNPDYGFACACSQGYAPLTAPTSGGSSYATFALVDDYLYRVDEGTLVTYNVSAPEKPKEISRQHVGWTIETLYPTQNYLFVGGRRGMYIYDRTDPARPVQISQIEHARACDPVVVSGSIAYVTLRGTSACGSTPDELLCVSIKQPSAPQIIGVKPLPTPWGLAVKNSHLYVSNGENGYSLIDVSRPAEPSVAAAWAD